MLVFILLNILLLLIFTLKLILIFIKYILKNNFQSIKEELLNSSFMFFIRLLCVIFHSNYILIIQYLFLLNKYHYKSFKGKKICILSKKKKKKLFSKYKY